MYKVLVVVDMQNDFLTGVLGNKECAGVVPNVVDLIQSQKWDLIICTQDTHEENYLETQEGKKLPVTHCVMNTEGWKLNDDVNKALIGRNVHFVMKPSFGSMGLAHKVDGLYKEYKEELELTFCGVCTGICVISNVLIAKASAPEAKVEVVENACACVTPESHKIAIEAMKTCQVDII